MARRGFIAEYRHQVRQAERREAQQQKQADRAYKAMVKEEEKTRKAEERLRQQIEKAELAERKQLEKEAKAAHLASMNAQVEVLNSQLERNIDDLSNILISTLGVDDYVDLDLMRAEARQLPFERFDLQTPTPYPPAIDDPPRPRGTRPAEPTGLSGLFGKKKYEEDVAAAERRLRSAIQEWQEDCFDNERKREGLHKEYQAAERQRQSQLQNAIDEHQYRQQDLVREIDALIVGLDQGDSNSVTEYLGIVLENSVYPDNFQISREANFDAHLSELNLKLFIPSPENTPNVKSYKYVKSSDEITSTALSERARKDIYSSFVSQIAVRTLHEIFEADRRGIVNTISLQLGTEADNPATGVNEFFLFVAVSAERNSFLSFDLSSVDPIATLDHLGASLSQNPYGLKEASSSGIRKSAAGAVAASPPAAEAVSDHDGRAAHINATYPDEGGEQDLQSIISKLRNENLLLKEQLNSEDKADLVNLSDERVLQSVGIYKYHHPLETAIEYQSKLSQIDADKSQQVRSGLAIQASNTFTYDNSLAKGAKMSRDLGALMLLAYNSQADSCIKSLRAGAVTTAKKRLERTRDTIAKRGAMMDMHVSNDFHELQIEELELTADYLVKKEEEKEAAREERARLREEKKVERELAEKKAKLEKERAHIINALESVQAGEMEFDEGLERQLVELEEAIEQNDYRIANTRAGYVYVISNLGAFGRGVVKIGLTRRLDPMDRVNELGDASVPFRFDVHCIYFSEDAVTLESELHKHFSSRRVNHANTRKEFFFAAPTEVHDVLISKIGKMIEFNEHTESAEFHQSLKYWPDGSANIGPNTDSTKNIVKDGSVRASTTFVY